MEQDLRMMALDSVCAYEKTGRKLDAVIHEKLKNNPDLTSAQRRFYIRLTQGCVENRIRLDHMIAAYSKVPPKKIRPVILWILRLSAYQITDMDGTPDSAIVNEAVKMAQKKGFGQLKGFVNAVLRNMIRDPKKVILPDKEDPVKYLSVMYSMPPYLAKKFYDRYGLDIAQKICASFLHDKAVTIRIKETDNDADKTVESLRKEGADLKPARWSCGEEKTDIESEEKENGPWRKNTFYLSGGAAVDTYTAFSEGRFFVQDLSSALAVYAAGIKEGDIVLDVCAAPGGKSMLCADLTKKSGKVVARDVSKERVRTMEENIKRMRFDNITAEQKDACGFDPDSVGKFDVVLVDAPCSGYGVIGKKPDIKYGASKEKEKTLAELQKAILHNAAFYVKPGGTLIYSTCTISETENEENAKWFLSEHDFSAVSLSGRLPKELNCEGNSVQLLPDELHDGFFIAAFQKRKE